MDIFAGIHLKHWFVFRFETRQKIMSCFPAQKTLNQDAYTGEAKVCMFYLRCRTLRRTCDQHDLNGSVFKAPRPVSLNTRDLLKCHLMPLQSGWSRERPSALKGTVHHYDMVIIEAHVAPNPHADIFLKSFHAAFFIQKWHFPKNKAALEYLNSSC